MVPVHPGPFPFLTNIIFNRCMQKNLHHFFTSAANSQQSPHAPLNLNHMQRPFPFQLAAAPLGIPAYYPAHTNGATIITVASICNSENH
jgi:hypothetical protein